MFNINNKRIFLFGCLLSMVLAMTGISNSDCDIKKNMYLSYTDSSVLENKSITDSLYNLANQQHLYESKCSKCHPLYQLDDFTGKNWENILKVMSVKSMLTDEEYRSLVKYFSDQIGN